MGMRYFIPTRNRVGRQVTLSNLPPEIYSRVTLVCPSTEVGKHRKLHPNIDVVAQKDDDMTIGAKREWIMTQLSLQYTETYIWMMDDDLKFRVWDDDKLVTSKGREDNLHNVLLNVVEDLHAQGHYGAVGLGTSFFPPPSRIKNNYHMGFAFGFDRQTIAKIKWNRMDVYEDIDYTLQLLCGGVPIAITYEATVDQVKADAPGGVQGQRGEDIIARDLQRLIEFFPGIVTAKEVRPGAHPAANTRVAWRKAAQQGGL